MARSSVVLLAATVVAVVATTAACGREERLVPRPRLPAEALRVSLDRKPTRPPAPGSGGGGDGVVFTIDGPVSARPVLLLELRDAEAFGTFDYAAVSLAVVPGEPGGGGSRTTEVAPPGETFWYVEVGRRGATLRPDVPLNLSRPASRTVRIESDRHGPLDEVLFYPGTTYELAVAVAGSKGLASQRVRFMVAP